MTESDSRSTDLVRKMATSVVPVQSGPEAADQRARVVARMRDLHRQGIESRRSAAKWRSALVWAAAAVLPALAVSGAWYLSHDPLPHTTAVVPPPSAYVSSSAPGVTVVHLASANAARDLAPIQSGDEVSTGSHGPATLTMPSGATLLVGPMTRLQVEWQSESSTTQEHILLHTGVVDVSVPKLGPMGAFSVSTPDTEVTVHGTRFSVQVRDDDDRGVQTEVIVRDGRVLTRHAGRMLMLGAGEQWSTPVPSRVDAAASAADTAAPEPSGSPTVASTPTPGRASPPANTLAKENELFESALRAVRADDDAGAIVHLDRLLRDYPSSPLAGAARRERSRAEQRISRRTGGTMP